MLRSSVPIPQTSLVRLIGLGSTLVGVVSAQVSGWGPILPDKGPESARLQYRQVTTVACAANGHFALLNQHLCASAAICMTDIGGPLTSSDNLLIGIASWHNPDVCGSTASQVWIFKVLCCEFLIFFKFFYLFFIGRLRENHILQELDHGQPRLSCI
jgi:hypothetical protein